MDICNTGVQNLNSFSTFKTLIEREDIHLNTTFTVQNTSYRSSESDSVVCHWPRKLFPNFFFPQLRAQLCIYWTHGNMLYDIPAEQAFI